MTKSLTKPKGATSYKETTLGIIPQSKLLKLEIEGTQRGLEYIHDLVNKYRDVIITPDLISKLHGVSFNQPRVLKMLLNQSNQQSFDFLETLYRYLI
jgi:hypothetical protein